MQVKEINNKNTWEDFSNKVSNKTFLQSWNWGEFQKTLGEKIWRLGIYNESELAAAAQIIGVEAKRGRFLLVPHGPILGSENLKSQALEALLERLKEISKREKCIFIRVSPIWERNRENEKIFEDLGFKPSPMHIHPELTWELDLVPAEEELLMNMRKTTRYLIKQGLKNPELTVQSSQDPKDVEVFNELYQKTVVRHHFVPFSLNFLKSEFSIFSKNNQALTFLVKYKGECLAAAIVIFWQGIAFYHQGASSQKHSKIPVSYLLQWEAIKEAKKRGCRIYNFWGIADVDSEEQLKNHPWKGLSLFKKGFGGYEKAYVKTQDLPLSKRYFLTYVFEKMRKMKRGF